MTQTQTMEPQSQETGPPLQIEEHTTVQAPIGHVYEVWRDVTRFPEFMSNVEEVQPLEGNRSHWVARIFGVKQEWDAEITDTTPNERVSWHSVSGAHNAGTVTFQERQPGITDVQVVFEYTPPTGDVGKTLDKLTKTTQREVKDLRNFKRLVSAPALNPLGAERGPSNLALVASLAGPSRERWLVAARLCDIPDDDCAHVLETTRKLGQRVGGRTSRWRAGADQSSPAHVPCVSWCCKLAMAGAAWQVSRLLPSPHQSTGRALCRWA
jgi:uncharacterized membrane protein